MLLSDTFHVFFVINNTRDLKLHKQINVHKVRSTAFLLLLEVWNRNDFETSVLPEISLPVLIIYYDCHFFDYYILFSFI